MVVTRGVVPCGLCGVFSSILGGLCVANMGFAVYSIGLPWSALGFYVVFGWPLRGLGVVISEFPLSGWHSKLISFTSLDLSAWQKGQDSCKKFYCVFIVVVVSNRNHENDTQRGETPI